MNKFKRYIISIVLAIISLVCFSIYFVGCSTPNFSSLVDFVVNVEEGRDIRVLQLTDQQIIGGEEQRSYALDSGWWANHEYDYHEIYVHQVVTEYNPDLIIVTGDNVYGQFDDSGAHFLRYVAFMESFGIPWAPVFGNHEKESFMGVDWQCQILENAEHCLFRKGELATGSGNYSVGIVQGNKLKRVFYMLDSGGCGVDASLISSQNPQTKGAHGFGNDQIDWYTESINRIRKNSKNTKFSMAFHVPFTAFGNAFSLYRENGYTGAIDIETHPNRANGDFGYIAPSSVVGSWDSEYQVWNGIKALGIDSVFVGHLHSHSASILYQGVRLQFGQKSSTYDSTNYRLPDGSIVTSKNPSTGEPIVGGTAIPLSEKDGSIVNPKIIYYDKTKPSTLTPNTAKPLYPEFSNPENGDNSYGYFRGVKYERLSLLDIGEQSSFTLGKAEKKNYSINKTAFSLTFNFTPTSFTALNLSLLSNQTGTKGYKISLYKDGIAFNKDKYGFNFELGQTYKIELGFIRFEHDEQKGFYNGNTGFVFVKVNDALSDTTEPKWWQFIELYSYGENNVLSFTTDYSDTTSVTISSLT